MTILIAEGIYFNGPPSRRIRYARYLHPRIPWPIRELLRAGAPDRAYHAGCLRSIRSSFRLENTTFLETDYLSGLQETHMISASSYATKWYITLFANSVPFQTQLRIWDGLLLDGQDVLVTTSLAIIYAYRSVITAANASFETILSTLSAFYIPEDEDLLMQWIHKMLKNTETRSRMDGWRKQWQELVRNKEDRNALL